MHLRALSFETSPISHAQNVNVHYLEVGGHNLPRGLAINAETVYCSPSTLAVVRCKALHSSCKFKSRAKLFSFSRPKLYIHNLPLC